MTATEQKYNKWKLRKEAFKKLKEWRQHESYIDRKILVLDNNNIKEIPSEIKELKDLEISILYHNNIQEIPIEILKKCDSLKEVWLGGDLIPKKELERANEELNIRIIYRTF